MRQVLFRIPIDGPWSLGPLGEFPGFGFGIVLLLLCVFGAYWLFSHRKELGPNGDTLIPIAIWTVAAVAVVMLPSFVQRGSRATIENTDQALSNLKPGMPKYREAHDARDRAWRAVRDFDQATKIYAAERSENPDHLEATVRLAWILATSPDDTIRNGKEAVELAEDARRMIGLSEASDQRRRQKPKPDDPLVLDVLAAAYAEVGDFDLAVKTAQSAAEAAARFNPRSDDAGELTPIRQRLELYQNNQPYRDLHVGSSLPLYGYGLMLFLGFGFGGWSAIVRSKWVGVQTDDIWDVSLWLLVGGIGGARLLYIITKRDSVFANCDSFVEYVMAGVNLRDGGLILYGGVLVGLPLFLLFCYRRKLNLLLMSDLIMPSFFIGLAFGRIGCLMNGCCYGGSCDLPWAVTFPLGSVTDMALIGKELVKPGDVVSMALHPTQIYSSINAFLLALLTHFYFRHRHRDGAVLGMTLLIYPITRFLIELLRNDEKGQVSSQFKFTTPSQLISMGVFVVGVIFVFWLSRQKTPPTPMVTQNPDTSETRDKTNKPQAPATGS